MRMSSRNHGTPFTQNYLASSPLRMEYDIQIAEDLGIYTTEVFAFTCKICHYFAVL